jgi:hypothetical protein
MPSRERCEPTLSFRFSQNFDEKTPELTKMRFVRSTYVIISGTSPNTFLAALWLYGIPENGLGRMALYKEYTHIARIPKSNDVAEAILRYAIVSIYV